MFENRQDAGKRLADKLSNFQRRKDVIVLGIARGGVVVAKVAAFFLQLPYGILVVRKIGAPYNPELAIGAVVSKTVEWDMSLCKRFNISRREMGKLAKRAEEEARERERVFGSPPLKSIEGETVILIDDGVATGMTVLAASKYLREKGAKEVVLAAPVIAKDTLKELRKRFDTIVAVETPKEFLAVGQFYKEFPQVTNEEVTEIL